MPKIQSLMGLFLAFVGAIVGFVIAYATGLIFKAFTTMFNAASGYIISGWVVLLFIVILSVSGLMMGMKVKGIAMMNWVVFTSFVGIAIFAVIIVSLLNGLATFGL